MHVAIREKNGKLRIHLSGELDHHGARETMEQIEETLERHLPRECVLDMGGVTFMDSSGIALILKTHRRMTELGGRVIAERVPKQPMRVLDAAGIGRIVSIQANT